MRTKTSEQMPDPLHSPFFKFPSCFLPLQSAHTQPEMPPCLISPHLSSGGHFWKKEKKEALVPWFPAFNLGWEPDTVVLFFFLLPLSFLVFHRAISNNISSFAHLLLATTHTIFIQTTIILLKYSPFYSTTALGALCPFPQEIFFFLYNPTFILLCFLLHLQVLVPNFIWKYFHFTHWKKKNRNICSEHMYVPADCLPSWYHCLGLLSLHSNFLNQCVHFCPLLLLFNSVLAVLTMRVYCLQHGAFSL